MAQLKNFAVYPNLPLNIFVMKSCPMLVNQKSPDFVSL